MNEVRRNGFDFNKGLSEKFDISFHDKYTIPTATLFGDLTDKENMRAWESFNGVAMTTLRWALATQYLYTEDTPLYTFENFSEFSMHTLYKAYLINNDLPMMLIMVRVSENDVLIYGKDVTTGHCAYGVIDLKDKVTTTNVGRYNLTSTLGDSHSVLFINYLTKTF